MPSVSCGSPSASPQPRSSRWRLCIGATTAIFSSVYSLMLKPLPYQEPERIVELYSSAAKAGLNHMPANVPFYLDYSTERDLLREPWAVDVLLRPGRRKGFCRPYPRRTDDRRNLQHPADTARASAASSRRSRTGRAPTRSSCSRSPTGRRSTRRVRRSWARRCGSTMKRTR